MTLSDLQHQQHVAHRQDCAIESALWHRRAAAAGPRLSSQGDSESPPQWHSARHPEQQRHLRYRCALPAPVRGGLAGRPGRKRETRVHRRGGRTSCLL